MTSAGPSEQLRVAAVQASPVFLDRRATTEKAIELIGKACGEGATFVVFPEAFIPAYPEWVWRLRPWEERATVLQSRLTDPEVPREEPALQPTLGQRQPPTGCDGLDQPQHRSTLIREVVHDSRRPHQLSRPSQIKGPFRGKIGKHRPNPHRG